MDRYIFDVDGTLTESRSEISFDHRDFLLDFAMYNYIYLVSGASYENILNQLGEELCNAADYIFACSGNSVYQQGEKVFEAEFELDMIAERWLKNQLDKSRYTNKTGEHLVKGIGSYNFSILGRRAFDAQRNHYRAWDDLHGERRVLAEQFNRQFPIYYCSVGGDTGVDIVKKGCDKSQITQYFNKQDRLLFFGDCMHPAGNDYTLAKKIIEQKLGVVYQVEEVNDTYNILIALSQQT